MNWQNIFNFFAKDAFMLIYSGKFNSKTLMYVTEIIANHYGETNRLKVKNIYIAIEIFQNIIRYANDDTERNIQFFQTRRLKSGSFVISSSNIIKSKNVKKIKQKIDELNSLSAEELKKHYKEILVNGEYSDKGGAGLGLIEMRRKTKQLIDYKFIKINDKETVFLIAVKYIVGENSEQQKKEFEIDKIWKIHQDIGSKDKLLIALKHNFSECLNNNVLNLLKESIKDEDLYDQKKLFAVNVEIIQNLSKYAEKKENNESYYFLYKTFDKQYQILIGNYILKENVEFLKDFLKLLKNSNKSILDEIYREGLRNADLKSAGLGYIDLVRMSKKFDYKFFNLSEEFSFFVLFLQV